MALGVIGIVFDELTSDPGSPVEGQVWYNTTSDQLKGYFDGATRVLADSRHTGDQANPHDTDLEEARTAGNTLSGDINMGGNEVTNVGGTGANYNAASEQYVVEQIRQNLSGLDWQDSVLDKDLVTAPGSPLTGDRYIIAGIGGGWSGGTIGDIAEWDGTTWLFSTPNEGFATTAEDENIVYMHNGTSWATFGSAVNHGDLLGLGLDHHTQYLLVNGTRAMSANLDMGTYAITNVGNVDGVDVSDHSDRHDPGGTDALTTAAAGTIGVGDSAAEGSATSFARSDHTHAVTAPSAPEDVDAAAAAAGTDTTPARADHKHDIATAAAIELTDSTNAEGTSNSIARADHTHAHGSRGGGSLHSFVDSSGHGFQPQSNRNATTDPGSTDDSAAGYLVGSYWTNVTTDESFVCVDATATAAIWKSVTATTGVCNHKAGRVLAASFSGSPKTAVVTFSSAFPDTNYAVVLTSMTTNNKTFAPSYMTKTAGSFTIMLGSGSTTDLVEVGWVAMADGES